MPDAPSTYIWRLRSSAGSRSGFDESRVPSKMGSPGFARSPLSPDTHRSAAASARASQSAPGFSNTLSQSAMTLDHPTEKPSPDGMEAALRHQIDAAHARFDIMNDPRLLMEDRESLIRAQETLLFERRHALICALHRAGDRAALRLLLDIPDWADAALDTGMYYTPGWGWISLDETERPN